MSGHEGGDAPVPDLVGDRMANRMRVGVLQDGARLIHLTALDVGARRAHVQQRQQPDVRWGAADRVHRQPEPADRLERLSPIRQVLAPRPLDERGQRTVGVGMGLANPFQPRRRRRPGGRSRSTRSASPPPTPDPSRWPPHHARAATGARHAPYRRHRRTCSSIEQGHRAGSRSRDRRPPSPWRGATRRRRVRGPPMPATPDRSPPAASTLPTTPAALAGTRRTGGGSGTSAADHPAPPRTGWRRSSGRGARPPSSRPVTAAHSSASNVSNTDVSIRKSTRSGGRARQHLAQQEVTDGPIGAGERGEEVVTADATLQRDRRQLGTRRPPLRELVQPFERQRRRRRRPAAPRTRTAPAGRTAGRRHEARAARHAVATGPTTTAGPTSSRRRTGSPPAAHR